MPSTPTTIRIFISSPGDVNEERQRARQVIEGLRRRYSRHFLLKPVLWEELPLQADKSFQQGIDLVLSKEHGVDIAVFILWSRLGTAVGPLVAKHDGGECRWMEFRTANIASIRGGSAIAMNPASSVRGPKYVIKRCKTPVLTAEEARKLLDSIDVLPLVGLCDRHNAF